MTFSNVLNKLWGGDTVDIVGLAANGGPGFPSMGLMKSNWPSKRRGRRTCRIKLREGEIDMFEIYDRYPVPASWVGNMFTTSTWEVRLRKYGAKATAMGPLTYGTRNKLGERDTYTELMWEGEFDDDFANLTKRDIWHRNITVYDGKKSSSTSLTMRVH